MAFSLEELMGYFFNNSGGGAIWYGGTGISYGPITGNPTGGSGTGSSYPDDDDGGGGPGGDPGDETGGDLDGTGSVQVIPVGIHEVAPELIDENGEYKGYVVLEQIQTAGGFYYMDINGNLYLKSSGLPLQKLTSEMAPVVDGSFLADGNYETITTDDTTYYIMPNGAIYEADGYGEYLPSTVRELIPESSYNPKCCVVDELPDGGDGGADAPMEVFWETITVGQETYYLRGDGKIFYEMDELWYPGINDNIVDGNGDPVPVYEEPEVPIEVIFGAQSVPENGNVKQLNGQSNITMFVLDPNSNAGADGIRKGYTVINGSYAVRTVYGTSGNDILDEGGWVLGGQGNDAITGNAFSDTLIGGDGMDTLNGAAGDDTLDGGADADVLNGGDGNDLLDGNSGNDFLNGGMGADTFLGGDGWDQVNYTDSQTGVVVDLENVSTGGGAEGDRFNGIEAVAGSAYGDQLLGNSQNNNLIGGDGDDYMDGRAGIDWLFGESGDDTLAGGLGGDFLIGGAGVDTADYRNALEGVIASLATGGTGGEAAGDQYFDIENLSGSNHDDQLTGDAGANTLSGNGGADLLGGGDGNDTLDGGAGADTLDGGSGYDMASYAGSASGVTVSLANGGTDGDVAGDVFLGIEGLIGSEHGDHLTGDAGANVLAGYGGADFLDGGDGHDALYGGASHDTLIGGAGDDVLNGDDGNDFLDGGIGNDTVSGGAGNDVITTGYGGDVLDGGDGDDTLVAGAGNDTLIGGAGANALDGGAGFDVASYAGAAAGVVVSLAPGAKALQADSFTSIEGLSGSSYGDRLTGDAGHNLLEGNAGDDTLEGGEGADTLVGGAGLDIASYANATAGVVASLVDGGTDGAATGDVFESMEGLSGSAYGDHLAGDADDNRLSGQAGGDLLNGDAGNDTLDGGAGDDTLVGGLGADAFIGGEGFDVVSYEGAASGVVVTLTYGGASGEANGDTFVGVEAVSGSSYGDVLKGNAAANTLIGNGGDDTLVGGAGADLLVGGVGRDSVSYQDAQAGVVASLAVGGSAGDAAGDVFSGIEVLIGSSHDDRLTGDEAANTLSGADGHDALSGGDGNDSLDGGIGDDTLTGGDGADALTGGSGFDLASYQGAGSGVVASLASGGSGGAAAGDVFSGIEGLFGSSHGDRLTGDQSHNLLVGNGGDDVLSGGGGNDTLDGGSGFDLADYSTERAGLSLDLTGGSSGDVLSSIEGLVGTAYDDVLTGNAGANFLDGGFGNDVLRGGAGSDTLTGGRGSDVFEFGSQVSLDQDVDWIMDFDIGEDRIQLDSSIFAGLRAGRLDQAAFALKIATTADHRIVYDAESGALFYDADGTGRIEQVKFAVLTPGTALNADHFLIV